MPVQLVSVNRVAKLLGTDRARIIRLAREARIKVYTIDGIHRIRGEHMERLWIALCIKRARPKRRRRRTASPQ